MAAEQTPANCASSSVSVHREHENKQHKQTQLLIHLPQHKLHGANHSLKCLPKSRELMCELSCTTDARSYDVLTVGRSGGNLLRFASPTALDGRSEEHTSE